MEHLFLRAEVVVRNSDDQRKRRRPRQRRENIIKLGTVSKNTRSFYVAQDRNHWKSLAIQDKIRFAQYLDKFLTDGLVTYQDGLSSKELGSLVVS